MNGGALIWEGPTGNADVCRRGEKDGDDADADGRGGD